MVKVQLQANAKAKIVCFILLSFWVYIFNNLKLAMKGLNSPAKLDLFQSPGKKKKVKFSTFFNKICLFIHDYLTMYHLFAVHKSIFNNFQQAAQKI